MSETVENYKNFEAGNAPYVETFQEKVGYSPAPPKKRGVIVTCMDARLDPAAHLGFKEGDYHVIRNAGGLSRDSLRSIIISQQLLGTREIAVFHHTDCGMLTFTDEQLKSILKEKYPDNKEVVDSFTFGPFSNLEESVKADVKLLQEHPLILKEIEVTGWIYETETGKVRRVV